MCPKAQWNSLRPQGKTARQSNPLAAMNRESRLSQAAFAVAACMTLVGCKPRVVEISPAFDVCLQTKDYTSATLEHHADGQRGVLQVGDRMYRIDITAHADEADALSPSSLSRIGEEFQPVTRTAFGDIDEPKVIQAFKLTRTAHVFVRLWGGQERHLREVGGRIVRCRGRHPSGGFFD